MGTSLWMVFLCGAVAAAESPAESRGVPIPVHRAGYQPGRSAGGLTVRWMGQDGHDFVSSSQRFEPNEVQDIHLAVGGLDPRHEVVFIDIVIPSGHHWQYHPPGGNWLAHLVRSRGATTADVFVDAIEMTPGSACHMLVRYDDGSTAEADFRSRRIETSLRMPGFVARAQWIGQGRSDEAGLGPSVGPDGFQDARIHLDRLSPKYTVKSLRIESSSGARWEFGMNQKGLNNAEFFKDPKDPRQGDVFFQPDRDLSGQRLRLSIAYQDAAPDATSVVAGRTNPRLRMPAVPVPKVDEARLEARWLGQDGGRPDHPGDVHVVLGGLPGGGRLVAMEVTDTVRQAWTYRVSDQVKAHLDGDPGSLEVWFRDDRRTADLFFAPYRETSRERFSVRLIGSDGRTWHGEFAGGPSELSRLEPGPDSSTATAQPGDDLQALLDRHGKVVLSKGTYRLARPLVLNRPSVLTSDGGATLLFAQPPNEAPWKTVIKLRHGNSRLEGFAVRFAGPIRWDWSVSYGPAIIGMTENTEPGYDLPKHEVAFRRLDIESPPVEDPSRWVEVPRMLRLVGAWSGEVVGNRFRGGTIEFFHGPWRIVENEYRGTPVGTFSHGFITGHWTHDLTIRGNRLSSPGASGKTWRFLVLTGSSLFDRIEGNTVEGVGSRDDETIPWSNEPEIILTEGYTLRYEGKVMAASTDGKILRIGRPQGSGVHPGEVVSILSGPAAGTWRRVAHVLDSTAVLLDRPVPAGTDAVSISQGFVGQVYEGNRIDIRGGRRSDSLVLPGNHFGLRVVGNHLIGGGLAWRIYAVPTESPMIWGWSHVPCLGTVIERNILEDTETGGLLGVEHHPSAKTNRGRVYMSVELRDNVVRWSGSFLSSHRGSPTPPALTLGFAGSLDPDEFQVTASGNRFEAPAGHRDADSLVIHAARFNGRNVVERKTSLSATAGSPGVGRRESRSAGGRPVR